MIRSGTVAFNDMYFFMERAADAVDEMGLRATLAYGFIDLGSAEKREAEIRATEALVSHVKARGNPRIQAAVGPHSVYTVSPKACAGAPVSRRSRGSGSTYTSLRPKKRSPTASQRSANARGPPRRLRMPHPQDGCGALLLA